MLPSPTEVEQCLQDAAERHQREASRLHKERAILEDDHDTAQELSRLIVEELQWIEPLRGEVRRTVLLADVETGNHEAFALVSHGGGHCVSVSDCEVQLVSIETPAGCSMLSCAPGDALLLGRVLAVNDSLTERAKARHLGKIVRAEQASQCRQARLLGREYLAAEQAETKRLEQEAFERRAEVHFQRAETVPSACPPKKQTAKERQKCAEAQQLKWLL